MSSAPRRAPRRLRIGLLALLALLAGGLARPPLAGAQPPERRPASAGSVYS